MKAHVQYFAGMKLMLIWLAVLLSASRSWLA